MDVLVLLAGEAGGGKSTVVEQLTESINGGARIVRGNCDPLSTPRPLGPLLDMATMLGRSRQSCSKLRRRAIGSSVPFSPS